MNDYLNNYKKLADRYLEANLKKLISLEKIVGTDCFLHKNVDDNHYDDLFGASSTVPDESKARHIRVIINKNLFYNKYNHQTDAIAVYTSEKGIDLGDTISFRTSKEVLYFKVESLEDYSIDSNKMQRIILSGYRNSG